MDGRKIATKEKHGKLVTVYRENNVLNVNGKGELRWTWKPRNPVLRAAQREWTIRNEVKKYSKKC